VANFKTDRHFCTQKWRTKPQGFTSRGVSRTSQSRRLNFTSSLVPEALLVKSLPLQSLACPAEALAKADEGVRCTHLLIPKKQHFCSTHS